jgi:tRNA G18 (ribose-2'-O)-methylase SpoU
MKNPDTNELVFTETVVRDPATRNVIDEFKQVQDVVAIRAMLAERRNKFINVCMNLSSDFNKATIVRTSNAFLAQEIWLVGARKFDPRGTVGTHHYETLKQHEDWSFVRDYLRAEGYTLYAVDNIDSYDPSSLWDVEYPEKSAFIYGEEQLGLSSEVIDDCDGMVYIPMQGSVRSLNAATAAGIIMSEYTRQHRLDV